ncbi:hypothetical protein [Hamadaea tsunoensis]|uniref:hypothetical protein n=1 Tax=Hamadaea tsunoensis TaxID=53368 RepID=UPI0012F827C4|nr:hypothetical protein [Hamadaea tsunoensis]
MSTVVKDRDHVAVAALSLITVGGVYLDGWAHVNVRGLETFFTPWHAVLYSGFVVTAAYLVVLGVRLGGRAGGPQAWWHALPKAYKVGLAGVATFAVGGAGDMLWHTLFGVEKGVDALLSPTHLVLLVGGMLLFSSAGVAAARVNGSRVAIALSAAAVGAAAAFFMSYLDVFRQPWARLPFVPNTDDTYVIFGVGGYLLDTAAILVPILLMRRHLPRPPRGALSVVVFAVAVGGGANSEYAYPAPIVGAVVGAVVADVLLGIVPWRRDPWLLFGFAAPVFVWSGQLLGTAYANGMGWTRELWAGVVVLCALGGWALAAVSRPAEPPVARDGGEPRGGAEQRESATMAG